MSGPRLAGTWLLMAAPQAALLAALCAKLGCPWAGAALAVANEAVALFTGAFCASAGLADDRAGIDNVIW